MPRYRTRPQEVEAVHVLDRVEAKMNDLRDAVRSAIAFSAMATETDDVMTLSELLRNERRRLGLSLEKVAVSAGMTKGHVWELENGRSRNPTIKAVYGIARALGLPFVSVCYCALKGTAGVDFARAYEAVEDGDEP